jgi:secondary thiamine-phosphate synthase enzyme
VAAERTPRGVPAATFPEVVHGPEPPWDMPASGIFLRPGPSGRRPAALDKRQRRAYRDGRVARSRAEGVVKAHTEYLTMNVPTQTAYVNITPQVQRCVEASGVQEGLCLVNSMHITASVFINDDERGLHHDFGVWLEKLAPFNPDPNVYHHNRTGEDNADAHLKRQVMGREVVVAVTRGKLDFGPWEQIFYGEFDGRRAKRVLVKIIGE